jgi:hypothetical protein
MPELIRAYIKNVLIGFALDAVFVAGLLYWDVMGLWRLVSHSPVGWIAVLMLFVSNGVIFAGVQFAVAILLMADDDDDDGPAGGHRVRSDHMVPVPAMAPRPAQRRR